MLYIISMHISHFMFFSWLTTCYVFYIYFRLGKWFWQKQIQVIFLFELNMGRKAAETIHNINNSFGVAAVQEVL